MVIGFKNCVHTEREQAKADSRPRGVPALCETLGRERGLPQGAGHRSAHGDCGRIWACLSWWDRPARHAIATGWAADRLRADDPCPVTKSAIVHVTLTDDHPWAQAFVVIEALPEDAAYTPPLPIRPSISTDSALPSDPPSLPPSCIAAGRPNARTSGYRPARSTSGREPCTNGKLFHGIERQS